MKTTRTMQLRIFKRYIIEVIREGIRLQKLDLNGDKNEDSKFFNTDNLYLLISAFSIYALPSGFSKEFAGYTMSFLAIFIGLFATIVIALHSNTIELFEGYNKLEWLEKAKVRLIRNYVVQFTGLTSYAIILALFLCVLLSLLLLDDRLGVKLTKYELVSSVSLINMKSIILFIKISILIIHRFLIAFLFLNFLTISAYATASYFSYLNKRYKELIK